MSEPTINFDDAQQVLPEIPAAAPAQAPASTPTTKASKTAKAPAATAAPAAKTPGQRRFRIVLEDSTDVPPTGLPLGINGRTYLLRPSEEAIVPEEVVHILNDAVLDTPQTDGNGNITSYRSRLRFPYRMLGEVK